MKINQLTKNEISGFGIIICLEALINSKTECTINLETISDKKNDINRFFNNSKSKINFYKYFLNILVYCF